MDLIILVTGFSLYMLSVTQSHKTHQARIFLKHVCTGLYTHLCVSVCVNVWGTGRLLDAFIKYERHWQRTLFLAADESCCATACEMISGPDRDY